MLSFDVGIINLAFTYGTLDGNNIIINDIYLIDITNLSDKKTKTYDKNSNSVNLENFLDFYYYSKLYQNPN